MCVVCNVCFDLNEHVCDLELLKTLADNELSWVKNAKSFSQLVVRLRGPHFKHLLAYVATNKDPIIASPVNR